MFARPHNLRKHLRGVHKIVVVVGSGGDQQKAGTAAMNSCALDGDRGVTTEGGDKLQFLTEDK